MDYQELAAEYQRESARRRQAEAEQQHERDELRKSRSPQATPPPDIINRAGAAGVVYKTNPDARVPPPPVAHPYPDDPVLSYFSPELAAYHEWMRDVLGMTIANERKKMYAHVEAAVDTFKRELFVLREELRLERSVRAMHEEIAAARADVPKIPEIEARVNSKQSKLAAAQARLANELAKTQDRVSKMRVDQSLTDYQLREHIKAFKVRDVHPEAAAAWREFCHELVAEQENQRASLQILDPVTTTGHVVELPVWKLSNAG